MRLNILENAGLSKYFGSPLGALPMPPCNCESRNCRGAEVSTRILKEHQTADQLLWRRQAYHKQLQVISQQDEALATEVTALTLGDSGPIQDDVQLPAPPPPKTCQDDAYKVLAQIENEITSLQLDLAPRIKHVGRPTAPGEDFPLREKLLQVRALEARVARLPASSFSFRQRKERSQRCIQDLVQTLSDVGYLWKARSLECDPSGTPSHVYDSGMLSFWFLDIRSTENSIISPPFQANPGWCQSHHSSLAIYHGGTPNHSSFEPARVSLPSQHASLYCTALLSS